MIETVSEFLEELKSKGLKTIKNNESDIKHTTTIGNIFEGLTAKILNQSLFKGLNLKIVNNSFIYNDNGVMSKEMDCMIVVGEGIKISFTNQYKYNIENVIGVVQVKKRLSKKAIGESHINLRSVIETAIPRDGEMYMRDLQIDSYKLLMGKILPTEIELESKSTRENLIYHLLLMQSFWPIRILIGYENYKTEYGLREGFANFLESVAKDGPKPGYNPTSFPDLIICGNNSIIKNVGMPFGLRLNENDPFYWNILNTSNNKPMYFLLEFIWTRLCYKYRISSNVFGDDFGSDILHPFLKCRHISLGDNLYGWEYYYHYLSKTDIKEKLTQMEWKPIQVGELELGIITAYMDIGKIPLDEDLRKMLKSQNYTIDKLVQSLVSKKIAYLEGNSLIFLLEYPTIIFRNGNSYIGENKNGQMMNWLNKSNS